FSKKATDMWKYVAKAYSNKVNGLSRTMESSHCNQLPNARTHGGSLNYLGDSN
ncbi:unnamed protein product, partial [Sphenostylis stenocarpa]